MIYHLSSSSSSNSIIVVEVVVKERERELKNQVGAVGVEVGAELRKREREILKRNFSERIINERINS